MLANFYHLVNGMGVFDCRGPEIRETDAAEIYRLYRPAFPGQYLAVTIESPLLGKALAIDGVCLQTTEGIWLFIVNRSPSEEAHMELTGLPSESKEGVLVHGQTPLDQFRKGDHRIIDGRLNLPPLSLARFRF